MSATLLTLFKAKRSQARGATDDTDAASNLTGRGLCGVISARRPLKPFAKAEEPQARALHGLNKGLAQPQEEMERYDMKIVITLDLAQLATALAILHSVM